MKNKNYRLTVISCFVGIFVQAIITNLAAILFIPLMSIYGFHYGHLGILVGVNFLAQLLVDLVFSGVIDRVGYRKLVLPANICAFVGLVMFALAPYLFENVFYGILVATMVFAAASGLLEILLSPIIQAIPGEDKGPAMSLLHSFYAWGQVVTIIATTLFLFVAGENSWQLIVLIWAIIPLVNFIMFFRASFPDLTPEESRQTMKDLILNPFYIVALFAIFFGAGTEVVMNQWSSTFMEIGLQLPKVTGDLIGMCGFAIMLGVGRTLYGIYGAKININRVLISGSVLAMACYIAVAIGSPIISVLGCIVCGLAVSLLWPGTLIITADRFPLAGAWMFAILAAAGDIGAALAPWMTGNIVDYTIRYMSDQQAIRVGILAAVIFPIGALVCHTMLTKMKSNKE